MTALVIPGTSPAYANFSRWVAECSRPDRCSWAARLERFQAGFRCPDCGAATEVVWPEPAFVEAVERLLMMRPHYKNRNWRPGETLHDLVLENGAHGLFAGLPDASSVTALLTVRDDGITADTLPDVGDRFELTAHKEG